MSLVPAAAAANRSQRSLCGWGKLWSKSSMVTRTSILSHSPELKPRQPLVIHGARRAPRHRRVATARIQAVLQARGATTTVGTRFGGVGFVPSVLVIGGADGTGGSGERTTTCRQTVGGLLSGPTSRSRSRASSGSTSCQLFRSHQSCARPMVESYRLAMTRCVLTPIATLALLAMCLCLNACGDGESGTAPPKPPRR